MQKLCCCNKVYRSTSGLLLHVKSEHSMEKPNSTQSDVSSNTQSASSTKRFKSACSQATLHNFMNFLRTSGRCNRQSEFTLLHFTIFH